MAVAAIPSPTRNNRRERPVVSRMLEHQLQCELNDSRAAAERISRCGIQPREAVIAERPGGVAQRLRDLAEGRRSHTGARVVEVRMVEDVEELRPKLQLDSLHKRNRLEQAHIPREHVGTPQNALAQGAES